ncbi:MAG: hypothetical protein Q8N44_16140 [Rubrivivax sp.]|nr:hypothetical protein [Rubrivivax sp.]
MSTALDPHLASLLSLLAQRQPAVTLPFIVTLAPGADAAAVVPFTPTLTVDVIRMVAGEMTAAQALALARHAQVETLAFDGQAQAIEALLAGDG